MVTTLSKTESDCRQKAAVGFSAEANSRNLPVCNYSAVCSVTIENYNFNMPHNPKQLTLFDLWLKTSDVFSMLFFTSI